MGTIIRFCINTHTLHSLELIKLFFLQIPNKTSLYMRSEHKLYFGMQYSIFVCKECSSFTNPFGPFKMQVSSKLPANLLIKGPPVIPFQASNPFYTLPKNSPSDFVKISNFGQILTLKWPPNTQKLEFLKNSKRSR